MKIIENKSSFEELELMQIAKRLNNKKRWFLLVNPSQGKHIPVNPLAPLKLFEELARLLKPRINSENILFIGFAETATAIGAGVASYFSGAKYIHTTREKLTDCEIVANFQEEHSHATEQTLQCRNWGLLTEFVDRIVFVEDEISTGRTILNCVNSLRSSDKVKNSVKFSAISILNGMNCENIQEFVENNVDVLYLAKIDKSGEEFDVQDNIAINCVENSSNEYETLEFDGMIDPRCGVNIIEYASSVHQLSTRIIEKLDKFDLNSKKIAVIGTEECMYPAIYLGGIVKRKYTNCNVFTHSTTRSPILPSKNLGYPINSGILLPSFYDENRTTYLYNISSYDIAVVVTDSSCDTSVMGKLAFILKKEGVSEIILAKLVD